VLLEELGIVQIRTVKTSFNQLITDLLAVSTSAKSPNHSLSRIAFWAINRQTGSYVGGAKIRQSDG
jgi:hypothetical protein